MVRKEIPKQEYKSNLNNNQELIQKPLILNNQFVPIAPNQGRLATNF